MRIIRVVHAGSVSLALCLPMLALGGGCDGGGGGGSAPASVKETPEDAAARGKLISDAYKSDPARKKQEERVQAKK